MFKTRIFKNTWMYFLILLLLYAGRVNTPWAETFSISYENGRIVRLYPQKSHPIIGLALSGGGARGVAHIGIIEVLENNGIHVERVAGTSMGSIVGGLYAAGYSPQVLSTFFETHDWSDILSSNPKRRSTYVSQKEARNWPLLEMRFDRLKAQIPSRWSSGQRVISTLSWLTHVSTFECGGDFDKLPIPFRSIATDLNTGNAEISKSGSLARAIQASTTIPLLFDPVAWDNKLLVDGGLINNLPVDVLREMGSDFVIAGAIEESMHPADELKNPLNIADQVTSITMRNITKISREKANFVISPDMDEFSSSDFSQIHVMIERGRQAALEAVPALLDSLSKFKERYRKISLGEIKISPESEKDFVSGVLKNFISIDSKNSLPRILDGIERLWATDRYFSIKGEIEEKTGIIRIEATPAPRFVSIHTLGKNRETVIDTTDVFSFEKNAPLSMGEIISHVTAQLRLIQSEGYSFANITSQEMSADNDTLKMTVSIPSLKLMVIDPNIKTRPSLITREFDMKPGDFFDMNRVMASVDNLYGTDLFDQVSTDVEPMNGGVRLNIHLKERNWSMVRLGLRYDEFNNSEGRINILQENILGLGNQLGGIFQVGDRNRLLMVENRSDRVYSSLLTFSIKAYQHLRKRPLYNNHQLVSDYNDDRYGVVFSVGQQMDKLGNMEFQLRNESSWTRYSDSMKKNNEHRQFRSIIVRSLIDSYDRYPFPRSGKLNVVYVENSSKIFGGTEQYVKIFWGNTQVKTFGQKHSFTGSLFLGTSDPSIPGNEEFTLGGNSTRLDCYNADTGGSLFYSDFMGLMNEEKTGTRLASARLSYRLFIPRYFYMEFLYGAGNVWAKGASIRADSLLQYYGLKGSFSSPFGPLSIGWGITSEGRDQMYMTAGWEF
jgi:NTE family protein